jgi:hypothetical protein
MILYSKGRTEANQVFSSPLMRQVVPLQSRC